MPLDFVQERSPFAGAFFIQKWIDYNLQFAFL